MSPTKGLYFEPFVKPSIHPNPVVTMIFIPGISIHMCVESLPQTFCLKHNICFSTDQCGNIKSFYSYLLVINYGQNHLTMTGKSSPYLQQPKPLGLQDNHPG
jgi:hypothetical protein